MDAAQDDKEAQAHEAREGRMQRKTTKKHKHTRREREGCSIRRRKKHQRTRLFNVKNTTPNTCTKGREKREGHRRLRCMPSEPRIP